jgi:NAD(P) transhydrogenase subunit alpha
LKIAVLAETAPGESRVAVIPETVKKFVALGAELAVESGAGTRAGISDSEFEQAGARVGLASEALAGAELILSVSGT